MSASRPPHYAFPWRRVLAVALTMIVVVALFWTGIQQVTETNLVPTPTQHPSTAVAGTPLSLATPTVVATPQQEASPESSSELVWPVGSFPAMLSMAPDLLAGNSLPLHDIARYSDISGWMAAQGISAPLSTDAPLPSDWVGELDELALPTSLQEFGLDPIWRQTYGFDLTDVQQVMVLGQAPDLVLLIRGDFEANTLLATWVASGYQPVEVEGETIWTLSPGDTIDLSAPESRPSMGALNNMVVLDDGTLVAAARMSQLGATLRVEHGDAPSLAEHADIVPLLEVGNTEDMATAYLARGSFLQVPTGTLPETLVPIGAPSLASPAALSEGSPRDPAMDAVLVMLAGVTPQDEGVTFRLQMVLEDQDAAVESAQVIEQRLETTRSVNGQPYVDVLGPTTVTVEDEVVLVDAQLPTETSWQELLSNHDLGFVAWQSPAP